MLSVTRLEIVNISFGSWSKAKCLYTQIVNGCKLYCLIYDFLARFVYCYRVYDCEHYRLVQTNVGHIDAVRSIIHIPERNQVKFVNFEDSKRNGLITLLFVWN